MPEGDTIFRAATVLRRVLAGQVVTGFHIDAPKVSAAVRDDAIVGSTVKAVESNGKHLFIHFDTPHEVVLHTHMKMSGSWHIYRPGERWWEPEKEARVVIRTENVVAPCFHPPIVELLAAKELGLHRVVGRLGPDIIRDDFDMDEALRRLREKQDRDIATALLDQSVISGIGNVFKVEALFLARTSPWAMVRDLSDDQLRAIVGHARKLIRLNRNGGERRTRFSLDPADRMWVDERAGLACHVCGSVVQQGWHPGEDVRKSWYCPTCQSVKPEAVYRAAPVPAMRMPHRRERL
jgi:endonuclease-8